MLKNTIFNVLSISAMGLCAMTVSGCSAKSSSDTVGLMTNGKSTKMIETPLGPKKIYSPSSDVNVKSAFKAIYDEKFQSSFDYYKLNRWHNSWYLNEQSRTIYDARQAQYYDVLRQGCARLATSICGEYYENTQTATDIDQDNIDGGFCDLKLNIGKLKLSECESETFRPKMIDAPDRCELNENLSHPSILYFPIGSPDFARLPNSQKKTHQVDENNWIAQMDVFFDFKCLKWAQQKP